MVKVDGRDVMWRQDMTVADLLKDLADSFPYAVVRVNGRAVTAPEFATTSVPDNAEVSLLHLVAGG